MALNTAQTFQLRMGQRGWLTALSPITPTAECYFKLMGLWLSFLQNRPGSWLLPDTQGSVLIQVPSEPSGSATQVQISIDPITAGSGPEQPGRTVLVSV